MGNYTGLGNPSNAAAVIASDTTVFDNHSCLFVGVGGDVSVRMSVTGKSIVFKNIEGGTFMPIIVKQVLSTGTTATDIVRMY